VSGIFSTILGKYGKNSTILRKYAIAYFRLSILNWRKDADSRYLASITTY